MDDPANSSDKGIDLDRIRDHPVAVDEQSEMEQEDFALYGDFDSYAHRRKKLQDLESGDIDNQQKFDTLDARRTYAWRIFCLLCLWVTLTYATVIASGYEKCPIQLSDTVLLALITSGSVNIIGLFAVVLNYLFPKR